MTATLVTEATRYLEAIELFRSLEMCIEWRSEADEVGARVAASEMQPPVPTCDHCIRPLIRINGQHICLRP